jgi:CBS domain containing-hemolysin-like protein
MDIEIIYLLILLIFSGFFSGTELAYVVANKLKIEVRARKKNFAALQAQYFVNHPQKFFSTILIGNNIVNIALASLSAVFFVTIFGWGEVTILVVSSVIILIFGEIIPKYFSRELADRVILISAIPLRIFSYLLYPFVILASSFSEKLTKASNQKSDNISQLFDREDVKGLVKESEKVGTVDKKDSTIINRVFELGEQRVYEAMTPRTDIVGVEVSQSINELISTFMESGFSKIPVYEENLDNIKGIVLAKDLFSLPKGINEIIREVSFIPETKKSFEVMNEFLDKKVSIAIVVDEYGGTAGIVTMEDILEELFGEIKDEFDVEEDICRKIAPNTFIISGKIEIDHLNEKYDFKIEEGDYETLAGYILTKLGRIPTQGETIKIDNFKILIARSSQQKIDIVKLIQNTPTGS